MEGPFYRVGRKPRKGFPAEFTTCILKTKASAGLDASDMPADLEQVANFTIRYSWLLL
jgi:hypothetical protein